ncbi:MD-2-related lipid-recognition protein-like [Acyrthosiphon pisum]|uniref:MD-2-related lipid-recognition domain-containing protein n=1 Tax=Acyrthosiphon pisum TaxID=7029 RepID=A0A8R2AZK4_ACYPI|nr:MD-2-related lipid-recognition protein-like [Acyrthosiphon pisum]|eukprot:XP_008179670.1 PREDICTED: MD-2-related lipid-recognition protein-like [Acyrthosiphon pisum]
MAIFVLTVVGLILAASAVDAEKVYNFHMCPNTQCSVRDLYIDPCPEAAYNLPCEWSENASTSIAFTYNPEFRANLPKTQLYAETFLMDLPFLNVNTDACLYTNCPVVKNTDQHWLFNLFVPYNYGRMNYRVKFMMWDNIYHQQCCFKFDINIV